MVFKEVAFAKVPEPLVVQIPVDAPPVSVAVILAVAFEQMV